MSLLGKILVVLNFVGVIAVAALAAMDYGKRQAWAYAVFREERALRGLPLDNNERDEDGDVIVNKFPPEELGKELFPQGKPVQTQVEEVKRVQADVKQQLDAAAGDKPKQMVECAGLLLPFAQTNGDRDRYLDIRTHLATPEAGANYRKQLDTAFTYARTKAKPAAPRTQEMTFRELFEEGLYLQRGELSGPFVDALFAVLGADPKDKEFDGSFDTALENIRTALLKEVDNLFSDALNTPITSDGKPGTAEEQKRRIARLLFNLATRGSAGPVNGKAPPAADLLSNADFKRAITVCGVKGTVTAAQDEARTVADMILAVELERAKDRTVFGVQHERFVDRLVERARQIEELEAQFKARKELADAHEVELKKRRLDHERLDLELKDAREETAKKMVLLRGLADKLHAEQIRFRNSTNENQDLEKEIRKKEAGR